LQILNQFIADHWLLEKAWFWFVVMTTIGYGNQSPQTTRGRTMVYTLGFCSILAFGSILATAGFLLDVILKDAAMRNRLQFLTRKCTACVSWGIVYYLWDLVIATVRHGPGRLSLLT
jgi:hypothetical protein